MLLGGRVVFSGGDVVDAVEECDGDDLVGLLEFCEGILGDFVNGGEGLPWFDVSKTNDGAEATKTLT